MDSKIIAGIVIGAVVIGAGSFYAGMQYDAQSRAGRFAQGAGGGQFFRATGARNNANGGFVAGTVIAKDSTSITLQLGGPSASSTNGGATGSKIVLYSASTQVGKFDIGTPNDLSIGDSVTVSGSANSDGSVSAQMIQIRPAGMNPRALQQ